MLLPQGSKYHLLKWIYKMLHILEQTEHIRYKRMKKDLYIVRSELFRDQQVQLLIQLA